MIVVDGWLWYNIWHHLWILFGRVEGSLVRGHVTFISQTKHLDALIPLHALLLVVDIPFESVKLGSKVV